MKSPVDRSKKLTQLLKSLPSATPLEFPDAQDPVAVLVQSWLIWDASAERALAAYTVLRERFVDFNELRVSMNEEILEALPAKYPAAEERVERLRATLRGIYLREHAVSMDGLKDQGKRDARRYVESIEGMVPYVSARVVLLSFGTHVIPVDGQLLTKLRDAEAVDEQATESDASGILTRAIKAGEGEAAHASLQAWAESGQAAGGRKAAGGSGTRRSSSAASRSRKAAAEAGTSGRSRRASGKDE